MKFALGLVTVASLAGAAFANTGDLHEKFQIMDANQDGKISRDEHSAYSANKFARTDSNGDGSVTAVEMDAALSAAKPGAKQLSAADKIRKFDQNGDGRLTQAEHTTGAANMFTRMDSNSDASLTEAELRAGHDKLMKPEPRP